MGSALIRYGYVLNPAIYKQDARDILWSQRRADGTTVLCIETSRSDDGNLHLFDSKEDFLLWRGNLEEVGIKCTTCGIAEPTVNGKCKFCDATARKAREKKLRDGTIDFLVEESAGTPIQDHVATLMAHYAKEVADYRLTGSESLKNAIENETNETILSLLDIVLIEDWNYTVRQSILNRISLSE